jgi:hypothetical protein
MKLNPDCIRDVLLYAEENADAIRIIHGAFHWMANLLCRCTLRAKSDIMRTNVWMPGIW